MESPPVATNADGGVATMPSSELRSLIASSQGPRPLSSVFAYRATRGSLRYPPTTVVRATHFASVTAAAGDRQEDERKPSPRQSSSGEIESDNNNNNEDNDMPALMERRTPETDSDSSSIRSSPGEASPSAVRTRSAGKRRAEDMSNDNSKLRKKNRVEIHPASANLKVDQDDMSDAGSCCICMCDPEDGERATIDGCDHGFCFDCIEKWGERENTCPLCKVRFSRISREGGRKKGQKGTKKVKQRDQRADLNPSSALEGLLAGLSGNGNSGFSSSIARLIFSGLGPTSGNVIDFGFSGAGVPRGRETRQVRWRNPSRAEDALLSDNDDDASDDGSRGYSDFVNNMRRMNPQRGTVGVFATYPLFAPPPPPPPLLRSYATNAHEPDAGGTADTALEIEDDSDDEVEVLDVRSSAGRNV